MSHTRPQRQQLINTFTHTPAVHYSMRFHPSETECHSPRQTSHSRYLQTMYAPLSMSDVHSTTRNTRKNKKKEHNSQVCVTVHVNLLILPAQPQQHTNTTTTTTQPHQSQHNNKTTHKHLLSQPAPTNTKNTTSSIIQTNSTTHTHQFESMPGDTSCSTDRFRAVSDLPSTTRHPQQPAREQYTTTTLIS